MIGSTQAIRACLAVAVTAFLLKPGLSTATLRSPPWIKGRYVGTEVFTPVPNVPIDAAVKATEPRIQVAPECPSCHRYNPEDDDEPG